jgi:hypothetical protein
MEISNPAKTESATRPCRPRTARILTSDCRKTASQQANGIKSFSELGTPDLEMRQMVISGNMSRQASIFERLTHVNTFLLEIGLSTYRYRRLTNCASPSQTGVQQCSYHSIAGDTAYLHMGTSEGKDAFNLILSPTYRVLLSSPLMLSLTVCSIVMWIIYPSSSLTGLIAI